MKKMQILGLNALSVANYEHQEKIKEKVLKLVNAASDAQLKQCYQYLKKNIKESLGKQLE